MTRRKKLIWALVVLIPIAIAVWLNIGYTFAEDYNKAYEVRNFSDSTSYEKFLIAKGTFAEKLAAEKTEGYERTIVIVLGPMAYVGLVFIWTLHCLWLFFAQGGLFSLTGFFAGMVSAFVIFFLIFFIIRAFKKGKVKKEEPETKQS